MSFLLGIDGGGTRTRAVLLDSDGRILGFGQTGPSNYHNVGEATAAANLREAASAAWRAAGLAFRPADHAFLGLAAIKSAADASRMRQAATNAGLAPEGALEVATDLRNALAGGLAGAPGIALVAGTGSQCLGRDASGRVHACGGWGWLVGDPGSAFGLAADALRLALRAADGCEPPTGLLPAALAFFQIEDPHELPAHLYENPFAPGRIAAFAPQVSLLAAEGDAGALRVLSSAASALAEHVSHVARSLDFPSGPDLVLLGGCLKSPGIYRDLIKAAIHQACPAARVRDVAFSPLHGAALNVFDFARLSPPLNFQLPAFD